MGGAEGGGGLWRGGSSLVSCRVQHGAGCSPQHPKDALSKATPLSPTPHSWVPPLPGQEALPSEAPRAQARPLPTPFPQRTHRGASLGRAAGHPGAFWGSFFAPGRPAGRATSAWEGERPKLAARRRRGGSQAFIPVNFGFRSWRLVDRGASGERLAPGQGQRRRSWQPRAGEDSALPAR